MLTGLFSYEWKHLRKMSNKYDRIPKLSSAWKHLRVTDNSDRLLLTGHTWIFSYWSERDKEPFGEFGLCHFMVHNRLVIVCIKVKSGKVCASHKNLSGFIVSTAYKLCMEIPVSGGKSFERFCLRGWNIYFLGCFV